MNRWLIVAVIVLATVLLLSPGLIGRLAEKNLDENLTWVDDENPDIEIEAESYVRGWFTSEGRHRITLADTPMSEFLRTPDPGDGPPAFVIETRIDHGIVPVTSMAREAGSLQPGLANAVSTVMLDRGDGELVELPGKIYSYLGLSGDTTLRIVAEPGHQVAGNATTDWSGADITVVTSPRSRRFSVEGSIEPITVESYGVTTEIGAIAIDAEQDQGRYSFGPGRLSLDVDSARFHSSGTADGSFDNLHVDARSDIDGNRVGIVGNVDLDGVTVPDFGAIDVSTTVEFQDLDADALEIVIASIRRLNASAASQVELQTAYPAIERELGALAVAGGQFSVGVDVGVDQGTWHSSLDIEIPPSSQDDGFSWPALLLKTTASATIRVTTGLYQSIVDVNPDAGALLATGMLKRDGDDYVMEAEYASGLLTVNGAPMTVPLGAPK